MNPENPVKYFTAGVVADTGTPNPPIAIRIRRMIPKMMPLEHFSAIFSSVSLLLEDITFDYKKVVIPVPAGSCIIPCKIHYESGSRPKRIFRCLE